VTSSVTSPFGSPPSLCYRLPIVAYPLAPLVSEIFDLKVADKLTDSQTSTSTDNKGPLKLSAREPIILQLSASPCDVVGVTLLMAARLSFPYTFLPRDATQSAVMQQ